MHADMLSITDLNIIAIYVTAHVIGRGGSHYRAVTVIPCMMLCYIAT